MSTESTGNLSYCIQSNRKTNMSHSHAERIFCDQFQSCEDERSMLVDFPFCLRYSENIIGLRVEALFWFLGLNSYYNLGWHTQAQWTFLYFIISTYVTSEQMYRTWTWVRIVYSTQYFLSVFHFKFCVSSRNIFCASWLCCDFANDM